MVVLHTLKQLFCKCFITIDYHQIAMGEMEQTPSTTMVLPSTESHGRGREIILKSWYHARFGKPSANNVICSVMIGVACYVNVSVLWYTFNIVSGTKVTCPETVP